MTPLRLAAVFLIAVEAVLFAYVTGDWSVAGLLTVAAMLGLPGRWNVEAGRQWRTAAVIVIAGAATLLGVLFPYTPPGGHGLFRFPTIVHIVGHATLAFQVLQLFVRPAYDARRIPWLGSCWGLLRPFPFYGVVVSITAGDISNSTDAHHAFRIMSFVYVAATVAYLFALQRQGAQRPASRTDGRVLLAGIVATAILLGSAGSTALFSYGDAVDLAFSRLLSGASIGQRVGFSTSATLSSVTNAKADSRNTTLRIRSDIVPAYMRGMAYDTYASDRWTATVEKAIAPPIDAGRAFEVQPAQGGAPDRLEIWPDADLPSGLVFHPLNTTRVEMPGEILLANQHGVPSSTKSPPGTTYTLVTQDVAVSAPGAELRAKLLAVPEDLDPRIRELAKTVIGDTSSAEVAAARVVAYFREAYDYELGIQVPKGAKPIEYFLLEKPAAHCEYFATASVLLLRLAGFPARYATGFVVHEFNPVGGYWLARSRDAHAWVEAFDPVNGWFTVEPTPSSGVPSGEGGYTVLYWLDYLRQQWSETIAAFTAGGIGAGLRAALGMLVSLGGGVLLVVLALLAVYLLYRFGPRWKRSGLARRKEVGGSVSPELATLHTLLDRRDKTLRKLGMRRERDETLHEFADRLSQASVLDEAAIHADWYRRYADLRFRGNPRPDEIAALTIADQA